MVALIERVGIRRVRSQDLDFIESVDFASDSILDWRYGGSVPGPQERVHRTWSEQVLDQRIIVRVSDGRAIGYATAYDLNAKTSSAWVAVAGLPDVWGSGVLMIGLGAFVTAVFRDWPLRRLLAESREASFDRIRSGIDGTAVQLIGTFPSRQRVGQKFHAVHWLEFDREAWMATYSARFPDPSGLPS